MSQPASDLAAALSSARREAMSSRERMRRLADAACVLERLSPAEAADAACRTMADLLALDAVWLLAGEGFEQHVRSTWTRAGGTAGRLGDYRVRAAADAVEGDVWQGRDGRYAVIAARLPGTNVPLLLLGAVRTAREFEEDDLACARLVAAAFAHAVDAPPAVVSAGGRTDDHMLLLQSLAGALARARSESDVAWAVVDELRTLIDYHACRFYLLSPDGGRLVPVAHSGSGSDEGGERELECRVGEGITGRALVDGLPRRIPNARFDPDAVAIAGTEPEEDESMLVAPMRIDGDPIGVIVLSKLGVDRFAEHDLRLLEVIASTAAVACENARLYHEAREQADVSQALLDLGMALSIQGTVEDVAGMVASAVDRLLGCAALSVWLRDGDRLRLAAHVGHTPEEQERLEAADLRVDDPPFGDALNRRLVTVRTHEEASALVAHLDHRPVGSIFAVVAIGERAGNRGAIVVQRGPRRGAPTFRDEDLLLGIADQALLAITNRGLYGELEESFLATTQALANALEAKDTYTGGHAQALIGLCTAVAERLGLSGPALRDVSFAAVLHDVGKIGIPLEIINKPGALTPAERDVMRQHPELGARILEPVPALAGARELVLACHEHWDGSGYPQGLAGEQIPLGARVILACDAFDAMTSDRVYRAAMTIEDALAELRRCAGSQFDPAVVDALIATVGGDEPARPG